MSKSKLPHQDPESEAALIGGILFGEHYGKPVDLNPVREVVSSEMFYGSPPLRHVFQAVCDAADEGQPIEGVALLPRLRVADPNENWQEVVNDLDHKGDPANAVYYAQQVREAWQWREILRVCDDGPDHRDPESKPADVIEWLTNRLRGIGARRGTQPMDLMCAAGVQAETLEWLWADRFVSGGINLIVGPGDVGKSWLCLDCIARVTTGTPWPDRQSEPNPKGDCILFSAEDKLASVVIPRLQGAGADLSRVFLQRPDDARKKLFSVQHDLDRLEVTLRERPETRLLVIDPIGSYLGAEVDSYRDNEVRSTMEPLGLLAEKHGTTILIVMHERKQSTQRAVHKILGSVAFANQARTVWAVAADPNNPARRLFLKAKNNLVREVNGLAFEIDGDPPTIRWFADAVTETADEVLAETNKARLPVDEATAWLKEYLRDGPRSAKYGMAEAEERFFSKRTVERARAKLKVVWNRNTKTWTLPIHNIGGKGNIGGDT